MLSPGPGGREELRCCHLVLGGREGGVVTWLPTSPAPGVEVTHACENITFARFATRAVIIIMLGNIFHSHISKKISRKLLKT